MHLPSKLTTLHPGYSRRDSHIGAEARSRGIYIAVSAGALIFLVVVVLSYLLLSRRVILNRKLAPSGSNWQFWHLRKSYGHLPAHDRSQSASSVNPVFTPTAGIDRTTSEDESAARSAVEAGVDRSTSVRSVMTLPAYSPAPKESEQVLGREGERAGMDTVIEFPETVDEEEARRDDEMESLYQIRLARRREIAERERRRQERREARDRGDWNRLEELRLQSRARADSSNVGQPNDLSAAALLAEHQSRGRDRRVSSVTYAAVGHVRHDGSRLRANSDDSERGGLLDGAAPMGEVEARNRATSRPSSLFSALAHPRVRNRSASGMSISTAASELDNPHSPHLTPPSTQETRRSGGERRSQDEGGPAGYATSGSLPTPPPFPPEIHSGSDDIGDSVLPLASEPGPAVLAEPPDYDTGWGDAPAYQSPVEDRRVAPSSDFQPVELHGDPFPSRTDAAPMRIPSQAPRLPHIRTLPSIHVESATEPNTPSSPVKRSGGVVGS